MNNFKKTLMTGLASLAMGAVLAPAHAQSGEGRHGHAAAMQAHGAAAHAKMAERFTERMAKLHEKLKLTAAQEPAWTAYVAAMTPAAGSHPAVDRAAMAAMSAPERMEKHLAMAKTHITTMEAHLAALKTFYATLTAEQKKTFDDNVMGGAHGPHRMMMHAMKKQ